MKRMRILTLLVFSAIVILAMVQVVVSNDLSTTGEGLGKIQTEISKYKRENTILSEKILTISSLEHVASLAASDGYVASGTPMAVSAPLPLAFNR